MTWIRVAGRVPPPEKTSAPPGRLRRTYTSAIADLLQVVAEPHRRDILRLIWTRELPVGEIARHFDVTQGSISQHLAILREAGLVSCRSEGNRRFYRAEQEAVGDLRPFLERMWSSSIDRLSAAIAEDQLRTERDVPN